MFPVKEFLKPWIESIIEMWEGRTWSTILSLLQAWHKLIFWFNLKTQNKQCVPGHRIGFLRKITGTNSHVYNLNAVNHKFRLCTIVHTSIFLWFTTFFKHLKILWLLLFAVPQMDIERIFRLKLHGTMQTFKIPLWSLFAVLHNVQCTYAWEVVLFTDNFINDNQWIAISRKLYR